MDFETLPSGSPFAFWDDETSYDRIYHVAAGHPDASDDNAGTAESPFLTIGAAAVTSSLDTLLISNNLTITAGGRFNLSANPVTVAGAADLSGGTADFNGAGAAVLVVQGNLTLSGTSDLDPGTNLRQHAGEGIRLGQ